MDPQQLTLLPGRTVWTLRDEPVPTGEETRQDGPADRALRQFSARGTTGPEDEATWSLHADDLVAELATGAPEVAVEPKTVTDRRRTARPALVVATGAALLVVAVIGAAFLAGCRWFVVETPSMGTAAPVGTLVITAAAADLQRGDVIAFIAPGVRRVYTHRVFAVDASGGIRTKGDINAIPDPWTIERSAVLGRAVAILPGAGFALRALPLVVLGGVLLTLLTLPIRRRDIRAATRVIGWHLVGTAVLLWLQPLVRIVVITSEAASDGVRASIVSTGLLPIRLVTASGDVLARLSDGLPKAVTLPTAGSTRIVAMPDLAPIAQLLLIGLAVLPSVIVFLVGLPRREQAEAV